MTIKVIKLTNRRVMDEKKRNVGIAKRRRIPQERRAGGAHGLSIGVPRSRGRRMD
jgi:hypothetical protein